ncbi:MAG: hypothetical protein QOJ20_4301 [Mycobacterium sp.]|jgi:hypothetical protein|nr:hypothetical protein [Mycobacterium sp.]
MSAAEKIAAVPTPVPKVTPRQLKVARRQGYWLSTVWLWGGEAEGVEEPAETAVAAVFGEELAQLGMHDGAGLAEELLA